jgi:1,4-dihydroxy-2-naphthoate octaprenyltransferase
MSYIAIIAGVFANLFPLLSLICLLSIPLMIKSGLGLQKNYDSVENLVPFMSSTLLFSRITGALFVASFLFDLLL